MDKKETRQRRARQTRLRIAQLRVKRLTVHRTNLHIYATIWSEDGQRALVQASTLEAASKTALGGAKGGNVTGATFVGKAVAERAKAAGIESVAFDRSGFRFHGRVKALAEAARQAGLKF
ncbi:MAG: 50S ribosomal protein L18 [Burkholderiaceae bacterium]|nr:50S ribosomal protein L18 [Burkholderiaceae bacterium]